MSSRLMDGVLTLAQSLVAKDPPLQKEAQVGLSTVVTEEESGALVRRGSIIDCSLALHYPMLHTMITGL